MELMERVRAFGRNLNQADEPHIPWYRRKKTYVYISGVALICFLAISAYIVITKMNSLKLEPGPSSAEFRRVQWDDVCPRIHDNCPSSFKGPPPVILVSLDGFHPSFMDRNVDTIKRIAKCGTHAPYMFSVFPTKTFPNHFSQVTGVYPAYHGIIDNTMYDPYRKKLFKAGLPEMQEPSWWQMEPIWVTAQKQGKRTGCYFWPGSDVKINGTYPTYWKKYNGQKSFESRVDKLLAWFDLPPSSRPHLYTLYVNQPDNALHKYGRNSKEVDKELKRVDAMIERLFSGLQRRNLLNCVDVIITSDHGHTDTSCNNVIYLQRYINPSEVYITAGPFGRIRPKGKRNETLVNELVSKLRCKDPHMRVFRKEQMPIRYHYSDNPRIEPIFIEIDEGWTVVSKETKADDSICRGGAHGYDNIFPDMRALFLAYGPSFKKGFTARPFINIELYEMVAELLDITPNPNNGTRGSLHYIMTSPKALTSEKEPDIPAVGEVPKNATLQNERLTASACSCPESEKQVNVNNSDVIKSKHLPFGIPYSTDGNSQLSLLYNEEYVTAFSLKYKMPLWSAYTLKEEVIHKEVPELCWNGDVRIPEVSAPKCTDFVKAIEDYKYLLQHPLYSPGFSKSPFTQKQAMLITNSVLKSLNHSTHLEDYFDSILVVWTQLGEINVITGPAFDIFGVGVKPEDNEFMKYYERNGPVLIPTHIYFVVTWCDEKSTPLNKCDHSKLQSQGFVLPNLPYPEDCEPPAAFIARNVARVVDVEKLTGLSFYKGLPIYEAIRLRTMMPERSITSTFFVG